MPLDNTHILLVDSYDSFTLNLAALCRRAIPDCSIHIIKNDQLTLTELIPYLSSFAAIVVGPGPGSPENVQDVGVVKDLWNLAEEHMIPIFGVCLGLQSLSLEFGARLKRLNVVKHGQVSLINHIGIEIFDGVECVYAVRYHSLHVELQDDGEIELLAWADDGIENGRVVMAVKHRSRPFWAVQYHPESVCTEGGGVEVVSNFWRLAQEWARLNGRNISPWIEPDNGVFRWPWPPMYELPSTPCLRSSAATVTTTILELPNLSVTAICELFDVSQESSPFVLLDSVAQPGRFSVIACLTPTSPRITYFVGDNFISVMKENSFAAEDLGAQDVWSWLASFMHHRTARGGSPDIPFWGGLVGYLTYELGVTSLPVRRRQETRTYRHADVNFVFVERSIVLDSVTGKSYLQSIIPDDDEWIAKTRLLLRKANCETRGGSDSPVKRQQWVSTPLLTHVTLPLKALYTSRINQAKEHLFSGDSYELCLTAHTRVSLPKPPVSLPPVSSSWERYKTLRKNNPAPHSAYLRLGPTTLLSSSPERFLSFSRPPRTVCQLRPIKGTIRKGPGVDRAAAEKALAGSTKEVAENLMIVDLIRHDLHGVVGENVQVKQFCRVEEYETVWQLVSVIEGELSPDAHAEPGWDVLRRSLPPGSMTGAPKKRSVEILQTLEDNDRNIYSGVFGYWCVGGGGDWSVTIRSCFKYDSGYEDACRLRSKCDDIDVGGKTEDWVIGAGGAITALSDPEAEWDEMIVKLQSVLKSFGATVPQEL